MKKFATILFAVSILIIWVSAESSLTYSSDGVYWHDNNNNMIALTFDDGPHYKYTHEILDILKEYNVKATFFVIGKLAERYPEIILRELAEGHEIGNHTWSHPKISKCSSVKLVNEIILTERILNEIADYRPKIFRPPEGSFKKEVATIAENNDYKVILWTVDTKDWAHTPPDKIVETVLEKTESGSIILCHDFIGYDSPTPDALREFIPALLKKGFKFVTVSELLSK
jgi:peptidoglycan/xylan/chitin deacetylase (PgdA/CDA1 family)